MKLEPLAEIWYAFLMHFLSNIVDKSVLDEQSIILNRVPWRISKNSLLQLIPESLENANAKGT